MYSVQPWEISYRDGFSTPENTVEICHSRAKAVQIPGFLMMCGGSQVLRTRVFILCCSSDMTRFDPPSAQIQFIFATGIDITLKCTNIQFNAFNSVEGSRKCQNYMIPLFSVKKPPLKIIALRQIDLVDTLLL